MNKLGKSIPSRVLSALTLGAATLSLGFFVPTDNDNYMKITRGLDIFGKAYREIAYRYVEAVDPEALMKYGIEQMLESLDPYTVFIDDSRGDEVEMLTNGRYGGIGVTVGIADSTIFVSTVIEGFAADRAGVHVDDVIVSVDSVDVRSMRIDAVRSLVRGQPGTTVQLRVRREDAPSILNFTLVREEIVLKNVSCVQLVGDRIGYIKLEHFTRGAGEEVRTALRMLRQQGAAHIVLDLRDNPGGLLDQAVSVVEQFVPRGNLVVSTRGRSSDADHEYTSEQEPVAADIPLVVMVNRESASASEIVAGALQDLDRALIVGTRTYGKGLVQTVTALPYNTSLKITTAKYYTPSGRCIQEIDYGHRKGDLFIPFPDSTKKIFFTAKKRPVLEEGGITPDSVVLENSLSDLVVALERKNMFRLFFNRLPDTSSLVAATPELLEEQFFQYLREIKYQYSGKLTLMLDSALAQSSALGLTPSICEKLQQARLDVKSGWEEQLRSHHGELRTKLTIGREVRLHGASAAALAELKTDPVFHAAEKFLSEPQRMQIKLGAK